MNLNQQCLLSIEKNDPLTHQLVRAKVFTTEAAQMLARIASRWDWVRSESWSEDPAVILLQNNKHIATLSYNGKIHRDELQFLENAVEIPALLGSSSWDIEVVRVFKHHKWPYGEGATEIHTERGVRMRALRDLFRTFPFMPMGAIFASALVDDSVLIITLTREGEPFQTETTYTLKKASEISIMEHDYISNILKTCALEAENGEI
mgnify:CR=1 FL=1